jgi:hypothetical protein
MKLLIQSLSVLTLATFLTQTFAQGTYYIDRDSCNQAQVFFISSAMNGAFSVSEILAIHIIIFFD